MSKASFYRVPVKEREVRAPRRNRPPKDAVRGQGGNAAAPEQRRRPRTLRRTALDRMPELKR